MLHAQFKEYLDRAEFVKGILDGQIPAETSTSNGAVGQKACPPGGGDKDVSMPPLPLCSLQCPADAQCLLRVKHSTVRASKTALSPACSGVREGQAAQLAGQCHHGGAAKREGAQKLLLIPFLMRSARHGMTPRGAQACMHDVSCGFACSGAMWRGWRAQRTP